MIVRIKHSGSFIIDTKTGELLPKNHKYDLQRFRLHEYIAEENMFESGKAMVGDIVFLGSTSFKVKDSEYLYRVDSDPKYTTINGSPYFDNKSGVDHKWKALVAYHIQKYRIVVFVAAGGERLLTVMDDKGEMILARLHSHYHLDLNRLVGSKQLYLKLCLAGMYWEPDHAGSAQVVLD